MESWLVTCECKATWALCDITKGQFPQLCILPCTLCGVLRSRISKLLWTFNKKNMCSVVKVLSSRLAAVDVATSWWRGSSRQPSAQTAPPHGCRCRRTACPSVAAAPWRSAGSLCACSCRPRREGTITLSHHHIITQSHSTLFFCFPFPTIPSLLFLLLLLYLASDL